MKTKCYCIFCPNHPLHLLKKGTSFEYPVGWRVGYAIFKSGELEVGADVNCLEPISPAFDDLGIYPEDREFPITAYGDGCAETGFVGTGFEIQANCANEKYEPLYGEIK